MSGTCEWITHKTTFLNWIEGREASPSPSIFWLIGLPAMGKTVLASYVVDYLLSNGMSKDCQYHFFSTGHQNKRTAAYCLRSIASQLAFANEEFREKLFTLREETGISFSSQDQNFSVIWDKIFEGIIFKMKNVEPLYWVLDAFDEADVPSMLISSLMRIRSLTPIRILITSRPTRIPSGPATCGSSINTYFLSEDDTSGDIRAYVRNAVREALPDDEPQIRDDIIEQVLSKAGGSFLWVKLALETLHHNWHTQDDIHYALTEMPKGMEHMYIRMLEKIETQSPRLQLMAKSILTWTACCWRPLALTELQTALEPEFSGFVRLQETIIQICGNFISVDNDKVSLIHMTARQFLLSTRDGVPAFIDSGSGHERIATVCLRHLSDEKWKRIFKTVETSRSPKKNRLLLAEKGNPFLGYSVCYYAYHVSQSSPDSEQLPAILKNFFMRYCLSWIEAIALSSNLRYLTRSAQFLKAYAKRLSRRPKLNDVHSPLTLKDHDSDSSKTINLWAIDFIRIVGKFGPNLIQSPSSVYRLIPPFCPPSSMIGTFYSPQERAISVTGLLSEGWDDCLASVNVGKEAASKVLATDTFFLILISSGTVAVWYAETCEEARRIQHGEYISFMEMNRSHALLATAGSESYRIWDILSGKQLYRLEKTNWALTMAIAFGNAGSELIVGLDDCSVTCYDLETSRQTWQFSVPVSKYHGCPLIMTISPDLTKVAVAWRGKLPVVWDLFAAETQGPLQCRARNSTDALFSPLTMQWQADANSILILCHNTKLVEWHIYEEEQHEFDHVMPHEMTVSQDGNFLLTSDHKGTISVFTFPRLSLIYQLINENEFIENLAFSPDGQRFYDIRGSICNIWEPDALVRPDDYELEDRGSSIATEPVITHDESSQTHVTALAYSSGDKFYCAGREDGTVCIHDAINGKKVRKVSAHSSHSSIKILAWSSYSDKYIVSGDDSGRIIAKRVELKGNNAFGVFPILDFRVDEPVQQFLFHDSEKLLLISTASADRIWDLKSKKVSCCRQWNSSQGRRWIQHPFKCELLIWIDPSAVHTYSWKVLEHADSMDAPPVEPGPPSPTASHGNVVHWVALTNNKEYIVYLSGAGHTDTQLISGLHLELLSTSDLEIQHPHSLTSDCMTELAAQIKRLIGTYRDRIVFLDHDYWLCTWRIDTGLDDVKRHFFLPKDWLNHNTLHMATLNAHGTFFCPKHGDVAIVRHGMRF